MSIDTYDVFLSYSHDDAKWVEALAARLTDLHSFSVWLDRWILVPGQSFQQEMTLGLDQANCCAVCVGDKTPEGWFKQEVERALDLQSKKKEFRVIPVLLPDSSPKYVPGFLSLRTWADFRQSEDHEYAHHVLTQGIKGKPVGRWPPTVESSSPETSLALHEQKIIELQRFKRIGVNEEVVIEFERLILKEWYEDKGKT